MKNYKFYFLPTQETLQKPTLPEIKAKKVQGFYVACPTGNASYIRIVLHHGGIEAQKKPVNPAYIRKFARLVTQGVVAHADPQLYTYVKHLDKFHNKIKEA